MNIIRKQGHFGLFEFNTEKLQPFIKDPDIIKLEK